jgi:hypothetical protein
MLNLILIWLVILTFCILSLTIGIFQLSKMVKNYIQKKTNGNLGIYVLSPDPKIGDTVWLSRNEQSRIIKGEGDEFLLQTKYLLGKTAPLWKIVRVMHGWSETIDFLNANRPAGSKTRLQSP